MNKEMQEALKLYMENVMFLKDQGYSEEEISFFFKVVNGNSDQSLEEKFDELLQIVDGLNEKVKLMEVSQEVKC